MASTLHTVSSLWREAVRDFSGEIPVLHFEKIFVVNRAVNQVVSALYTIVSTYYKKTSQQSLNGPQGEYAVNRIDLPAAIHTPSLETDISIRSVDYPLSPIQRLSPAQFQSWRPWAAYNRGQIVYTLMDAKRLYFMQGTDIKAIGSVVLTYPGLPEPVASDSTYLDIPDSMDVEPIILKIRSILHNRNGMPNLDINNELARMIRTEYEKIGIKLSKEQTAQKIATINEA